jgi:hypothetical protein
MNVLKTNDVTSFDSLLESQVELAQLLVIKLEELVIKYGLS